MHVQAMSQLLGSSPLPWERLCSEEEVLTALGPLGPDVLCLLSRDSSARPCMAAVGEVCIEALGPSESASGEFKTLLNSIQNRLERSQKIAGAAITDTVSVMYSTGPFGGVAELLADKGRGFAWANPEGPEA